MYNSLLKIILLTLSLLVFERYGFALQKNYKYIMLTDNNLSLKHKELLVDILELELLLKDNIGIVDNDKSHNEVYKLRQEVNEISDYKSKKKILEIRTVLYDSSNVPVLSQLELVKKLIKEKMIKRAQMITEKICEIFFHNHIQEATDLFLTPSKTITNSLYFKNPLSKLNNDKVDDKKKIIHKNFSELEIFGALVTHAHGLNKNFFTVNELGIRIGPYPTIGVVGEKKISKRIDLAMKIFGTLSPIYFQRPLLKHLGYRYLKTIDIALAANFTVMHSDFYWLNFGVRLASLYFSYGKKFSSNDLLFNYWQLKQGVGLLFGLRSKLLKSKIALYADFFPLMQNFSTPSKTPFDNRSWAFGFIAENKIYKALSFRLTLQQTIDRFSFLNDTAINVSTMGQIGFLLTI